MGDSGTGNRGGGGTDNSGGRSVMAMGTGSGDDDGFSSSDDEGDGDDDDDDDDQGIGELGKELPWIGEFKPNLHYNPNNGLCLSIHIVISMLFLYLVWCQGVGRDAIWLVRV
ncbi:hypothetical protein Tsubulata_036074 [Turnera subulata]|uniref:Uncharacterized protein n=1 Tax=Turnera subulata TaxID=218843 RepID=A0A9Q0J5U9_9ROSI|nr:hypothetical protein Tsubulata_036074 [Turnera subulata]